MALISSLASGVSASSLHRPAISSLSLLRQHQHRVASAARSFLTVPSASPVLPSPRAHAPITAHARRDISTSASAQQAAPAAAKPIPKLFEPITIRGVTARNRIWMSPMCMYSCYGGDGLPTEFHLVHLGARAMGGAGLVMVEASAIVPEGRISNEDMGIWSEAHVEAFKPVAAFIKQQGAVAAIQLAHAGRKACTLTPLQGGKPLPAGDKRGWTVVAPSAVPFDPESPVPHAMTLDEIKAQPQLWVDAAQRALRAGFQVVELHFAHGYLLNEFLSPISNKRTDDYGGSLGNRMRLPLEVAAAVRKALPDSVPLFVRVSATDYADPAIDGPGWDVPQTVELCKKLKALGVDLVDVSSGGSTPRPPPREFTQKPGYQSEFSEAIRKEAGITTASVGLITAPQLAEELVAGGRADAVFLGRAMLRDPHWALRAAQELGAQGAWPGVYYGGLGRY